MPHELKVGDMVWRTPVTFYKMDWNDHTPGPKAQPLCGRVVYIHPQGHYHTVAFDLPGGTVLESFHGIEP